MKKAGPRQTAPEMSPEYEFRGARRGTYASRYAQGVLAPSDLIARARAKAALTMGTWVGPARNEADLVKKGSIGELLVELAVALEKQQAALVPMTDGITHVVVEKTCAHCKGVGNVPGGQREYGELVPCPICEGRKRTQESIPIEAFAQLFKR